MARRKIVFIIVEGVSDETALGIAFSQIFDKESVYVHIMHGDITTRSDVTPQNIVAKIGNEVKKYAASNHFDQDDFKQIIHIVDTDAAYLSSEKIFKDSACEKLLYEDDGIYASDVDRVLSRNRRKTENLYRLRSCGKAWNIPYRVYYMSCNLDHVLYDKRNSLDEEKESDSYLFAKTYRNDVKGFLDYMCNSPFSIHGDFKKSWEFIEENMHSIQRYTNLPICLREATKDTP